MSSTVTSSVVWVMSTVAVGGGLYVAVQQLSVEDPVSIEPAPLAELPVPEFKVPPSTEVIRIDDGLATIAGRGNPGERLVIMDGANIVAETEIAADGTYALVFDYEVPDEGAILEVSEQDEFETRVSNSPIAVMPKVGSRTKLAKLEGNMIQLEVDNREELSFAGVVYEEDENAIISGTSTPNTELAIYLNDIEVGVTAVSESGEWNLALSSVDAGLHSLRIEASDEQELSADFERKPTEEVRKIARGDTLWQIAELKYGDGRRYVDIYRLNSQTISDPNVIFPDQEFSLPLD